MYKCLDFRVMVNPVIKYDQLKWDTATKKRKRYSSNISFHLDFPACRLVKGDGEIIEEIVSREQQKAINKVYRLIVTTIVTLLEVTLHTYTQHGHSK